MKITLKEWAARRYNPVPSKWILGKWVASGDLSPPPEIVGKTYYIDENARRLSIEPTTRAPLADRIRGLT